MSATAHRSLQLRAGLLLVLSLALLWTLYRTQNWPLVGDAALMHYAVFLLHAHVEPYRQLVDINLPGTWWFEAVSMAIAGAGAGGARLYDAFLLLAVGVGLVALAGRRYLWAAVFAALLFALVHLQDGVAQSGQRDLLLAALMLIGLAAWRRCTLLPGPPRLLYALLFGLAFGVSCTVKPVLLPLFFLLIALSLILQPAARSAAVQACTAFGLLLPAALVTLWLYRAGSLGAFVWVVHALLPVHASMGRKPTSFLLAHSTSPFGWLFPLAACLALVVQRVRQQPWSVAIVCIAGALIAYVLQGKGYPYQRYPLLALLLFAMAVTMQESFLAERQEIRVSAATAAIAATCFAVHGGWRATRYQTSAPAVQAISRALSNHATRQQLDGHVQCLDTFSGCINALYDLRLQQSTGFLYDCYLFDGPAAIQAEYRQRFLKAFQTAPPRLIVLTSQDCFKPSQGGYDRLRRWPDFAQELQQHYHQVEAWQPSSPMRWFSRPEMPFGFRILERSKD